MPDSPKPSIHFPPIDEVLSEGFQARMRDAILRQQKSILRHIEAELIRPSSFFFPTLGLSAERPTVFTNFPPRKARMKTLNDWLASQPYLENRTKLYHQAALLETIRNSLEIAHLWRIVDRALLAQEAPQCAEVYEQTAARLGYGLGVNVGPTRSIPNPTPTDKRLYYRADIALVRGRSITIPDMLVYTLPVPQTGNDRHDIHFEGYKLSAAIEPVIRDAFNQVCIDLVANAFDCEIFNHAEILALLLKDPNNERIGTGEVTELKITRFLDALAAHYTAIRSILKA